jgi:hypothetical protein
MLDALLDWSVVFLPTVLSIVGVVVSMKVPQTEHQGRWRIGLLAFGILVSVATFWQQSRSRHAHAAEVELLNGSIREFRDAAKAQNSQIAGLNTEITGLKTTVSSLSVKADQESARRQQSEKDMALMVRLVGQSTRAGINEDLRRAPISVQVDGKTAVPVNQVKMTRISEYANEGRRLKQMPPPRGETLEGIQSWLKRVDEWWARVNQYLNVSCTAQAVVIANDLSQTLPMNWGGIHEDRRVQSTYTNLDRVLANLTGLLKQPELCP